MDHDVERVSHVGLYEIADAIPDMGRSRGLHKMRWRVQTCELDSEAVEEFEALSCEVARECERDG